MKEALPPGAGLTSGKGRGKRLTQIMDLGSDQPVIIWLASYPRSGNKLTQVVLNTLYGVRRYSLYPKRDAGKDSLAFRKGCDLSTGLPEGEPPLEPGEHALVKTHEWPDFHDRVPAVYIIRDGRDAYVSYAHFSLDRNPEKYRNMDYPQVLEMLIRSTKHFGGWSAHVEAWTTRPHPTAVIRYEDMLVDPENTVVRACASLGMELAARPAVLPTFEEEHAKNPTLVRRGKTGSWREEMPPHLESLFWSIHGSWMERLGYSR